MKTGALALAATIAAASIVVPVGSALGATSTFKDGHGSKASTDIRWVRVTNERHNNHLAVKVRVDKIRVGSTLVVYVDRNLNNPGPELRMVAAPDSEWNLYRVHKWGQRGQQISTCGRVRMSAFHRDHRARWTARRSCLNIHGAVRVAVKMIDPQGRTDWAPKRRSLYAKVNAR